MIRLLLRLASLLVPSPARPRWREEWMAEMDHVRSSGRGVRARIRMAAGSIPDALATRRVAIDARRPFGPRAGIFHALDQDIRYALRGIVKAPGFALRRHSQSGARDWRECGGVQLHQCRVLPSLSRRPRPARARPPHDRRCAISEVFDEPDLVPRLPHDPREHDDDLRAGRLSRCDVHDIDRRPGVGCPRHAGFGQLLRRARRHAGGRTFLPRSRGPHGLDASGGRHQRCVLAGAVRPLAVGDRPVAARQRRRARDRWRGAARFHAASPGGSPASGCRWRWGN